MNENFKTSQTQWSLPEGQNSPSAPSQQWGNEPHGVPGPVTQPVKGEITKIDAMSTSQQRAREHDKPEGQ